MEEKTDGLDSIAPSQKQALPFINEVHAAGRITNAVTVRNYDDGRRRAQFTIAVPRPGRKVPGRPDVYFFSITAWGILADECAALVKGTGVEVQGKIQTWQNEDKSYHWCIAADRILGILRLAPKARTSDGAQELIAA